ncbi:hypothetical protein PYCCODRAFT_87553 [Trametes coccinea BRFM310]|uniref:Uncharacterized protein n=1 Tax=Trametes coccinea (strain BRFM310) TaxID=1353009 RepID=A0A1Y2I6Z3_TRAC3|nr:hypothetical protein PYCCODRAFT_87553 [Trametes coccinea BRFM310]
MTTVTEGGYVYVDDSDPKVVYSGDWGISNTEYAWHETLHFASEEGSTASLKFTGTWISVVGGGGDTNQFGYPSTSYVIDGKNYKTLQTSADASHDTYFDNVTMFTSPTLDAGEHTLVITNLNGTKPNTFWLDYFWYPAPDDLDGSAVSSAGSSTTHGTTSQTSKTPATSHSMTTSSSTATTSSSTSTGSSPSNSSTSFSATSSGGSSSSTDSFSLASSSSSTAAGASPSIPSAVPGSGSVSVSMPAPSETAGSDKDLSVGASSRSQNVGAIVGGAIGGAVLLALFAILAVYLFLRHRMHARSGGDMIYKYKIQHDASPGPGGLFPSDDHPHTPSLPPDPFASGPSSETSSAWVESAAVFVPHHPGTPEPQQPPGPGMFVFRPVTKDRGEYAPLSTAPEAALSVVDTLPPPYSAS